MTTVFVGSYGPAADPGIHALDIGPDGDITWLSEQSGIVNPSFLALAPEKQFLFAVSETGLSTDGEVGHVYSFRIERLETKVQLIEVDRRPTGGDHPCHIAVDERGRWLAVSNYSSGNVSVFPVASDGRLGDATASIQHSGSGARPDRQEGPHAHSAIFAPNNRFLIVADLGIDRLTVHHFSDATGSCEASSSVATNPGSGPRHMAFHPDGSHLFVVNELDNTLALYRFDGAEGTLDVVDVVPTMAQPIADSLAADVHVDPSGRRVYVSNRGHDSIAVFEVDPNLRRQAVVDAGGEWPRGFAVAPDGAYLVVAHRRSDEVVVLSLSSEVLGSPIGRFRVGRPSCVIFV